MLYKMIGGQATEKEIKKALDGFTLDLLAGHGDYHGKITYFDKITKKIPINAQGSKGNRTFYIFGVDNIKCEKSQQTMGFWEKRYRQHAPTQDFTTPRLTSQPSVSQAAANPGGANAVHQFPLDFFC